MLSAPVSENKTKEQQGKAESEFEMEGDKRSGGWAGYGSLSPGSGRLAAVSQPMGKQAQQAVMQKVYGNQAMLRMMDKSPAQTPVTASPLSRGGILQRKCACGNAAGSSGSCAECQEDGEMAVPGSIQTKLTINEPGDRYEQEADRVAEQVMTMPDPAASSVQRMVGDDKQDGIQTKSLATSITPLLQREMMPEEEEKEKKEEESIQTKPALQGAKNNNSLETDHNLESRLNNSSSGSPLPHDVRSFMEPRFGADFSRVRVHTGSEAVQMNQELNAQAFTHKQNIYFGTGKALAKDALTAHELTHVVQQQQNSKFWGLSLIQRDDDYTDPYQAGYKAGLNGLPSNPPAVLNEDALDQYNNGYAKGSSDKAASAPVQSPTTCTTPYLQANTFQQLIDLVRAAETRLRAVGITSPKDQIHALRGIYYGTAWSRDFVVAEKSTTRNEGFQRFTRPSEDPGKSVPPDISGTLDCGLFNALQASQDIHLDPSGRHIDFGHLIIGLDARFDPAFASNVQYPVLGGIKNIDLGGTGTELVTWVGDLGAGAASLAINRVGIPTTKVSSSFTGSDYGGSINLEGDVAGYVVATGSASASTSPTFLPGKGLSEALEDYLSPSVPSWSWNNRATTFLKMNGGVFDAAGLLANRNALITAFSAKIQTFACNYLASRVKDSHVPYRTAVNASNNVIPASQEVAEAFVDALDDSHKTGDKIEAKRFPTPKPAIPGACSEQITAAGMLNLFK